MRRTFALMLAVSLVLTACAGDDDAGGESVTEETVAAAESDGGEFSERTSDDGSDVRVDLDAGDDREVIRRASLELHASDTRAAFDEIVTMVESVGGFVANANVFPTSSEDEQPRVSMTLRVPSAELNQTMTAIKESVDDVVAESQRAEDVTEQFIDLEARLTNLQALETELRALLEEVRMQEDADPEKLLRVFNELSSVRGQIEQIQGQINYLEEATTLATLEVQLTQTPSSAPIVDEAWAPAKTVRDALGDLVNGLQGVADWAINFVLYVLPMLLIILGPIAAIGVFVYRRFLRKPATGATPAES
ncbi:MAG: DUF4349 domain-containing protein [Actinomycetota bacterium]